MYSSASTSVNPKDVILIVVSEFPVLLVTKGSLSACSFVPPGLTDVQVRAVGAICIPP